MSRAGAGRIGKVAGVSPFFGRAAIVGTLGLCAVLGACSGGGGSVSGHSPVPPPATVPRALAGAVMGGRQPIAGAQVVAYAAGTGMGSAAAVIGTATTGLHGNFNIEFAPTPATGQLVYVVASGGEASTGGANAAIELMTAAGVYCRTSTAACGFPNRVNINELTTVAGAAALQGYLGFDCSAITGGGATGDCPAVRGGAGLDAAAKRLDGLVNAETGKPSAFLAAQPATSGNPLYVSLGKLDTLANILAACVNTVGSAGEPSPACSRLFAAAFGRVRNTLEAAYAIAAWPGVNVKAAALYALRPANPIYHPGLAAAPADWTIAGGPYVYVSNGHGGKFAAWRLSRLTGVLAPLAGGGAGACSTPAWPVSPDPMNCFAAGGSPGALARDPGGKFLWIVNEGDGGIATYAIDPATGTPVPTGTPIVDDGGPAALAVAPSGDYLYAANRGTNTIGVYAVNAATGTLTPVGTVAAASAPTALAVDPLGRYVYVADAGSGAVSAYAVGADGGLGEVPGSPYTAGSNPASLAVDPSGRYLYVADRGDNDVSAYAIGTDGALTRISGSPYAAGSKPDSIAVDPSGHYVYAANKTGNSVSAYVLGAGGGLVPIAGGPFAAGNNPVALALGASGRYAYVANEGGNNISAYRIAQVATVSGTAAGALLPIGLAAPYPSGRHTDAVIVDPTGRYVWAANINCHDPDEPCAGTTGSVSAWRLDPASGALVSVPGSPFAAGVSPQLLAVSPDGRFIYVANCGDVTGNGNGVTAFRVDGASGALDDWGFNPLSPGNCPYGVTVAPDGGYVYTANYLSSSVSVFSRNADGSLDFIQTAPVSGSGALSVAITPDGQYLYVSNNDSGDVSAYTLNAATGLPSEIPGSPFAAAGKTDWVAVDPVAPFVYAVNYLGNSISGYAMAPATAAVPGALAPLSGSPFAAGPQQRPRAVAIDPGGRYVYVANHTGDDVSAWRILADGNLQAVPGSPFPAADEPLAITVDPSGRYVYTANHSANNVSAFRIGVNGALAPIMASSPFPAGSGPEAIVIGP